MNNAVARAAGLLTIAVLPPLAELHGEAYRSVLVMVHGFRLVTVYSVVLLVLAAAVVTVGVPNPAHKAG